MENNYDEWARIEFLSDEIQKKFLQNEATTNEVVKTLCAVLAHIILQQKNIMGAWKETSWILRDTVLENLDV